jgi:cytochrome c-type biogenesis protein
MEDLISGERSYKSVATVFIASISFVIGFSIIFVAFGIGSESLFGNLLKSHISLVRIIGGIIIIIFGFYCLGVFKIGVLGREVNFLPWKKKGGIVLGSLFLGIAFAVGWTPCIGPILASILLYTSMGSSIYRSAELLSMFSIGLGIPFILTGIFITYFMAFFKKIKSHLNLFSIVSGVFLILMGILTISGNFEGLSQYIIGKF